MGNGTRVRPEDLRPEGEPRVTTHRCTCRDPKEQVCHVHREIKVDWLQFKWMVFRSQAVERWCRFKWWVARAVLGELYYHTVFVCPECGNHYGPAREDQ